VGQAHCVHRLEAADSLSYGLKPFIATVSPQFNGTPAGGVTFQNGTVTLGSVTLSAGVAQYTTSTLTPGTHTITATYNASSAFKISSATLTQTVKQKTIEEGARFAAPLLYF
jgi:hypothetical protein